jgi:hypothetical protein
VSLGFASKFLEVSRDTVIRFCEVGILRATLFRKDHWLVDEHSLFQWHDANRNTLAAARAVVKTEAEPMLCPRGACEAHWERCGQVIPAFRVSLCRGCFRGRPLRVRAE